jgi:hypothetical protein
MAGALREVLAKFGFDIVDKDKLDSAEKKADGFADKLKAVAGLLAGAEIVGRAKDFVLEIQEAGDALNDTSAQLGVATDELQRWQFAAQMSGSSAGQLNTALLILQKNVAAAAEGGGEAGKVFADLGIPIKNTSGQIKSATQIMGDVGIEIAKLETPSERTAAALKVFGKQGASLVPIFANGEAGLSELLDRFDELGGGYSDAALEGAGAVGDAIDEMNYAVTALKSRLAASVFPTLAEALRLFTKWSAALGKATDGTNIFGAAAVVAGGIAAKAAIGAYARYLPLIAGIALLVLLVDDLMTAFKGGDSVVGKFIDKLLGEGAGKDFFKWLNEGIEDMGKRIDKLPTFAEKVEEVFSSIGFSLVKFFADDLPDAWDLFWRDLNKTAGYRGKGMADFWRDMLKDWRELFFDWVEDVTDDIINGFTEGIKDKWKSVTDSFTELAEDLKKILPTTFKAKSPAQVPRDNMHDVIDGAILGLADRSAALEAQAKEAWSGAMPPKADSNYVPLLGSGSGGGTSSTSVHAQINQTNHNKFEISGASSSNLANAARDGVSLALNDDRRAALAALETAIEV